VSVVIHFRNAVGKRFLLEDTIGGNRLDGSLICGQKSLFFFSLIPGQPSHAAFVFILHFCFSYGPLTVAGFISLQRIDVVVFFDEFKHASVFVAEVFVDVVLKSREQLPEHFATERF
jgi:hypothetical protein